MKRISLLCALLALLLAATAVLSGCAAQDKRVAVLVGDREITMQQFKNAYQNSLTYAAFYYDMSTDEGIEAYQDEILDSLIQSEMLHKGVNAAVFRTRNLRRGQRTSQERVF